MESQVAKKSTYKLQNNHFEERAISEVIEICFTLNLIDVTMAEVLREGWLTKSPPEWKFWTSKWKPRYFVLQVGQTDGQTQLKYYTDEEKTRLRGSINLDRCEQVDAYLTYTYKNRIRYQWIFDIRIPKRVYYLVAGNENEMNAWVNDLCCVCNLQREQNPEPDMEDNQYPDHELISLGTCSESVRQVNGAEDWIRNSNDISNSNISNVGKQTNQMASNGTFGRTIAVQGYIPLTDCISGPPRPKHLQKNAERKAFSELPPTHPPPPLPFVSSPNKSPSAVASCEKDVKKEDSSSISACSLSNLTLSPLRSGDDVRAPPPRPPKRSALQSSVGNMYENEEATEETSDFSFYDRPLPPCSLFSSLPRAGKNYTGARSGRVSSLQNQSFGTLPRSGKCQTHTSTELNNAASCTLSDLSVSSSNCSSLNMLGLSPPTSASLDYCNLLQQQSGGGFVVDHQLVNNNTAALSSGADNGSNWNESKYPPSDLPPEVRRELKPTNRQKNAHFNGRPLQTIPLSLDAQPRLPYRLTRTNANRGARSAIKAADDGASAIDLSRQVSFSKKHLSGAEAAQLVAKTKYGSVVNVPALKNCNIRMPVVAENTTFFDPYEARVFKNASSYGRVTADVVELEEPSGCRRMEYVEVGGMGEAGTPSPTYNNLPSPFIFASSLHSSASGVVGVGSGSNTGASGGGGGGGGGVGVGGSSVQNSCPSKTSYVLISQEKTQGLLKTKSEQDNMYKTGTLERNKLGSAVLAMSKR
ncbi:Protein daughter of sevenless [Trichinella murrelli]|uniref:Protein daughter of sevenless n=1 Tax=Trichinella murrelli TaxID=144512 RepID=A0A0V0UB61_9BILA|nr:Protein daughter of sevenless [Trichinella murrelli]